MHRVPREVCNVWISFLVAGKRLIRVRLFDGGGDSVAFSVGKTVYHLRVSFYPIYYKLPSISYHISSIS
jgi:hypothetical protein